ncbi:MAG: hypothetical protein Q9225_007652, partial [Loekoesia sp. 1 TL-2023]
MPRAAKRIKTGGVDVIKTTVIAPSTQRGIQAFGRISKAQSGRSPAGKSKVKPNEQAQSTICETRTPEKTAAGRKRTAQHLDEEVESGENPEDRAENHRVKQDEGVSSFKLQKLTRGGPHPKTPRKKAPLKTIPMETPTKGARSYLESLDLSSSPSSKDLSLSLVSRANTPASSPPPALSQKNITKAAPKLPEELQDLINLHSSFLTALSLHYTHHGSLAPADFRVLRPNIERSWRKRRVSIRDIQQLLALQQTPSSTRSKLSLSDFGSSKICIEIEGPSEHSTPHKQPLNEDSLNKIFRDNLIDRFTTYRNSRQGTSPIEAFVNSLPLAPITPCTSATALAPLLAKGQRRLEDLKAGAIKAQARSHPKTAPTTLNSTTDSSSDAENIPPTTKSADASARKTSLLDRIKQKQEAHLRSTALHTPLTPSQIQRKAAFRRIEEIVPVIELLGSWNGASGVKTFTMPTIVQHLQMSLRNPIEKEEAVKAVRLLAEEVAPEWIGVKE